jgi:hypothetical protein
MTVSTIRLSANQQVVQDFMHWHREDFINSNNDLSREDALNIYNRIFDKYPGIN